MLRQQARFALKTKGLLLTFLLSGWLNSAAAEGEIMPPKTMKQPHQMTIHGDTRTDDYYWMRDDNRKDQKIIDYLTAENKYTEQMLKPGEQLRDTLYEEMVSRMKQDDQSVPYTYNGYIYRTVYEAGKDFPIYQRKPVDGSADWQVLVDGNERAKGQEYYQLSNLTISLDNKRIAIAEDTQGRRNYQISFKDIADNQWSNDVIKNTSGNIVWANDSNTLFYVRKHSQTLLPYQVFRHQYGTNTTEDQKIYQEEDERFYLGIAKSSSRDYIMLSIVSNSTSEYLLIDANKPQAELQVLSPRQEGREYYIDHFRDYFYIRSNHESETYGFIKLMP